MLEHALRVRDLVHGFVMHTELEKHVINHRLFQRLREVRQNGVSLLAYPSLTTSRFTHSLGACHIVGKMAERLTASPKWETYLTDLKRKTATNAVGIETADDFVQVARLYALLHDIGHLPLSHLFEMAMESYARSKKMQPDQIAHDWFGESSFSKAHETLGAILARKIVADVSMKYVSMKREVADGLLALMTKKKLATDHLLLYPVKMLVDSEIDGDRIDSVGRDGLLAGGEYGNHDIDRLASSVFLEQDDYGGWFVAYSEKAVSSMEALLFDRYRTHVWIHFHHRVVATNLLVEELIGELIKRNVLRKEHFNPEDPLFPLRDDIWLYGLIRGADFSDDALLDKLRNALLFREKEYMLTLWKDRVGFQEMSELLQKKTQRPVIHPELLLKPEYRKHILEEIGLWVMVYEPRLTVEPEIKIALYSEKNKRLNGAYFEKISKLLPSLREFWNNEPRYYVVLFGDIGSTDEHQQQHRNRWLDATASWLREMA